MKNVAIGWLSAITKFPTKRRILTTAIEKKLCNKIPEKSLKKRLIKIKQFADDLAANKLRKFAINHKAPFNCVIFFWGGDAVFTGRQSKKGIANVCQNGQFAGKHLQVLEPVTNALVEVETKHSLGIYTDFSECLEPNLALTTLLFSLKTNNLPAQRQ